MKFWIGAILLRAGLLIYGEWHDSKNQLKFTDVDYNVLRDAAKFVYEGQSPYLRSTYRYTPILSWLLIPNILLSSNIIGKLIFILGDFLTGYLIQLLTSTTGNTEGILDCKTKDLIGFLWLLNPFVAVISTRGNADSLTSFLVLLSAYLFYRSKIGLGSIALATAVHFKIYPIIYTWPVMVYLSDGNLININQIKYFLVFSVTLVSLTLYFYSLYGYDFLYHGYLYHISRKDHRHNFSIYYPVIYMSFSESSPDYLFSMLSFIPQVYLLFFIGYKFAKTSLIFSWFLQTMVFVTFNKVCTSQYFLWYLQLLPCVIPLISISFYPEGILLSSSWLLCQAIWLSQAYRLEMLGDPVFYEIWISSAGFFIVNCLIMVRIISSFNPTPSPKIKIS